VGTLNLTQLYSVLDDLCVPAYVEAGRDEILVSLWTLRGEACRRAPCALCRLVKAEQQAGRQAGNS
jgi:hypothetical protein